MVSSKASGDGKRDSRMNIENHSKKWNPEKPPPRQSYQERGRQKDLFKQLLDANQKFEDGLVQDSSYKQKDNNHYAGLRSQVVVKSSITTGSFRGNEEKDKKKSSYREERDTESRGYQRSNKTCSNRDIFADKRSHRTNAESSLRQGIGSQGHSNNKKQTNKKTKQVPSKAKPKLSMKSQKQLSILENDLFRYNKNIIREDEDSDEESEEIASTSKLQKQSKKHSAVPENTSLDSVRDNSNEETSLPHKLRTSKSPEILENRENNESIPSYINHSQNELESFAETGMNETKKSIIEEEFALKNKLPSSPLTDPEQSHICSLNNKRRDTEEKTPKYPLSFSSVIDSHKSGFKEKSHTLPILMPNKEPEVDSFDSNKLQIFISDSSKYSSDDEDVRIKYVSNKFPDVISLLDDTVHIPRATTTSKKINHEIIDLVENDSPDINTYEKDYSDIQIIGENLLASPVCEKEKKSWLSPKESEVIDLSPEISKSTPSQPIKSPSQECQRYASKSPSMSPTPSQPIKSPSQECQRYASRSPSMSPIYSLQKKEVCKSYDHNASSSKRSHSTITQRSKSPLSRSKSPISHKNKSSNRWSKSRSRSHSRHRSISRNRVRRRYSRSPDNCQRHSRSPPYKNRQGFHSYRNSDVRNRSPDCRSTFPKRYDRSPHREHTTSRMSSSISRYSDAHSRSKSAHKQRQWRKRHISSSSSSSSSSHNDSKRRNVKKSSKGRKKKPSSSSSSNSSARSKRSDSDST